MSKTQISWERFAAFNNHIHGINAKFEELCKQLFVKQFIDNNNKEKLIHCNPNNPGIEIEPIYDEISNKRVSFQAKYFETDVSYHQIKHSAKTTVKYYKSKIDTLYLFCNKKISTRRKEYKEIKEILEEANIELLLVTDTEILDIVRKYPSLGEYYFSSHHISHEWFVDRFSSSIYTLGERFNRTFNVDTETSKTVSIFLKNKKGADYFNAKKESLMNRLKSPEWQLDEFSIWVSNYEKIVQKIPNLDINNMDDVFSWNDTVKKSLKEDLKELNNRIKTIERKSKKGKGKDTKIIKTKLNKYRQFLLLYNVLELSEKEKNMLQSKLLVVEGEAGVGKTQLFANETKAILDENKNALLILASDCLSDSNMLKQLSENLRIDNRFEIMIDLLEIVGENTGQIIPIFIDALNESLRKELWRSTLPILYRSIKGKKYVRLVVSFRNEFEKIIIPEGFLEEEYVYKIEHKGFKNDSIRATREFLDYYEIPFTPLHMFTSNLENPLFLTIYCKTYRGDNPELPVLYDRLIKIINDKIHIRMKKAIETQGYDSTYNLVMPVVESIASEILLTGKKFLAIDKLLSLKIWESLRINPRVFIVSLVNEGLLLEFVVNDTTYYRFVFDHMNDYFSAKSVFSKNDNKEITKKKITESILGIENGKYTKYGNEEMFVCACCLYSIKFKEECIDIIENIKEINSREYLFEKYIMSFEWRNNIYMTIDELLELCNKYSVDKSILWKIFINNSIKEKHLMNAETLHSILKGYTLVERDFYWTTVINEIDDENDRVSQLIKMFNKGDPIITSNEGETKLLLIVFAWLLTSSNRWLRDTTAKAMIEILKYHFDLIEYLLEQFIDVNDPYILQRLYAVAFGACTKRTDDYKGTYKSLVEFVFENVFNKSEVYPDILLRDYAKLIIENFLFEYPGELENYDLNRIEPLYSSTPIPQIADQKYLEKELESGLELIRDSMRFEEMFMYGDFGRYVFQNSLKYFDVDEYEIYNYALYYIINNLGYKNELFGEYDSLINNATMDRHHLIKIERIGKKYQWIAMYNILARVSDHYKMKDYYSIEEKDAPYEGPWNPYVRDFDPTLNDNFLINTEAPSFEQIDNHIRNVKQEISCDENDADFDDDRWIESDSIFFTNQKKDLILTDKNGNKWITLLTYANTNENIITRNKLDIWNWIYGFCVTNAQLSVLKEHSRKKISLFNENFLNMGEYSIYNREFPWAKSCFNSIDSQWMNIEIYTDKKRTITKEAEIQNDSIAKELLNIYSGEIDEKTRKKELEKLFLGDEMPTSTKKERYEETVKVSIGEVLKTYQDIVWEEEYDASKKEAISFFRPCSEIINNLKLIQKKYDGYYYSEDGQLVAFDNALINHKTRLVIRKEYLDSYLKENDYNLAWIVNGAKEIIYDRYKIEKESRWTGLLYYDGNGIEGDYYKC